MTPAGRNGSAVGACDPCLRRMALVARLAPYIERIATGVPGARSPELLGLPDADLVRAVAGQKARELLAADPPLDLPALRARLRAAGCWSVCRHHPAYPVGLLDAGDAPPALAGLGDPGLLGRLDPDACVTVVGARRATPSGEGVARDLAAGLAAAGLVVVSGMANGIDSAAHRGALGAGGISVAVLGTGPDIAYPQRQRRLHADLRERGLVLAELPAGARAFRWCFPARNRILAALARLTIVVEAAERSGSLITAQLAADLGRDIGAVPGPVTSPLSGGSNALLADGAAVVRDAQDALDALLGPGRPAVEQVGPPLDPAAAAALDQLERGLVSADAIASGSGREASEVAAALARLELYGYAERDIAGRWWRTTLHAPER